ncbi:MAG: hypothetical protein BGO98_44630 [Myxococcales bacterium 68-20]|nr:hypothetical protein [Myxococcales bacterium]OJY27002.1 MAG: hypothetical protein BGO98_44630 [Myxococcales bacterium 68-20]
MTELPRPLAPWAKQLGIFPSEIALALGAVAARLTNVLGASGEQRASEGAPDGFAGLAPRGSYERLLLTEWLLQDELPEEFVRRVVSGEHSFLERAYRRDSGARRSLVLFDAGPDQLGAPRVVHLASLVVLAQRAAQRNATLAWGALQDDSCTLHHEVTTASVTALLQARGRRRASPGDVSRWGRVASSAEFADLWLVGPDRLTRIAGELNASVVAVSEVLEPGASGHILAKVFTPHAVRAREALLELPSPRIAVQLLRDPFGTAVAPRRGSHLQIDPSSNIIFAVDGRKLHVRGEGDTLVTVHIPNSPRAAPSLPVAFVPPAGQRVLAVGQLRSKKRTIVATIGDRERGGDRAVFLHTLSKRGASSHDVVPYALPPGYDAPELPHLRPLGVFGAGHACFIDGNERLVELAGGRLSVKDEASSAASKALRDGLAYVSLRDEVRRVVVARPSADTLTTSAGVELSSPSLSFHAVFGPFGNDVVAYRRSSTSWTIVRPAGNAKVSVAPGHTVIGALELGYNPSKPYLVVLDEARTAIALVDPNSSKTVVTTTTPIAYAAGSDASHEIAFITRDGELGIYSCAMDAMLLRVAQGTP